MTDRRPGGRQWVWWKEQESGVCAVPIPATSVTVSVCFMCKMRIIRFIVCELELIYVFKTDCKYC